VPGVQVVATNPSVFWLCGVTVGSTGTTEVGTVVMCPSARWVSAWLTTILLVVAVGDIPGDTRAAVGIGGAVECCHGGLGSREFGKVIAMLDDISHLGDKSYLVCLGVSGDPVGLCRERGIDTDVVHGPLLIANDGDGEWRSSSDIETSGHDDKAAGKTDEGTEHDEIGV